MKQKKNNNTQNTHIHLFVYALNWTCSDSNFHRTIEYILVHLRIMFNAHDKLLLFHWFVFVVHKFFLPSLLFYSFRFVFSSLMDAHSFRGCNTKHRWKWEEWREKKNRKSKRKRDEKKTLYWRVFSIKFAKARLRWRLWQEQTEMRAFSPYVHVESHISQKNKQ